MEEREEGGKRRENSLLVVSSAAILWMGDKQETRKKEIRQGTKVLTDRDRFLEDAPSPDAFGLPTSGRLAPKPEQMMFLLPSILMPVVMWISTGVVRVPLKTPVRCNAATMEAAMSPSRARRCGGAVAPAVGTEGAGDAADAGRDAEEEGTARELPSPLVVMEESI